MGSIPVITKTHLLNAPAQCKEFLLHWNDAPIVVLDSWDRLYPRIEKLMADPDRIDRMQVELRLWYNDYMNGVVGEFEDYMIDSYI